MCHRNCHRQEFISIRSLPDTFGFFTLPLSVRLWFPIEYILAVQLWCIGFECTVSSHAPHAHPCLFCMCSIDDAVRASTAFYSPCIRFRCGIGVAHGLQTYASSRINMHRRTVFHLVFFFLSVVCSYIFVRCASSLHSCTARVYDIAHSVYIFLIAT